MNYDYKEANDFELLFLVKEQNEDAEEILIKKYTNVINKIIDDYINIALECGLERGDLFQEGLLGLSQAMKTFNESKEASFYTYACICITTKIKSTLRRATSQKNAFLNNSVSLDNVNKTEENNYYSVVADENNDLSDQLLKIEEQKDLFDSLNNVLTEFEKEVLKLKIKAYTNDEIADSLNKDKRSIENAITRIRTKYKKTK